MHGKAVTVDCSPARLGLGAATKKMYALKLFASGVPDPFVEDHGQQGSDHGGAALGARRWRPLDPWTLETKLNLFNHSGRWT